MLFSSLNTGSTDLRDTEVQQPNTAATFSLVISSRAFSANSGQFEAGSTTTASSFLPRRPPFLFCSSISISITSFSVVSLIAMVPESECRMPTLIVSWACAEAVETAPNATAAAAASQRRVIGRGATAWIGVSIYNVLFELTRAVGLAPARITAKSQGACQRDVWPPSRGFFKRFNGGVCLRTRQHYAKRHGNRHL